jgi:carboxypeptidase family protein
MLVVYEKPFHSRSLSGFVLDYSHAPIPDVLVEECTEKWESCFAHTRTDQTGRFSWPGVKKGRHFLKISSPGFNPTQIIVVVSWHSKAEFRLNLNVAT